MSKVLASSFLNIWIQGTEKVTKAFWKLQQNKTAGNQVGTDN